MSSLTAVEIMDALDGVHRLTDWVVYREAWRIDMFALGCVESANDYGRVGYEVKVSMADLRSELRQPEKRAPAMELCDHFYFAVPEELVEKAEPLIPEDCGLVAVLEKRIPPGVPIARKLIAKGATSTSKVVVVRAAPKLEPRALTMREVAYLARFQWYREKMPELRQTLSATKYALQRARTRLDSLAVAS